MSRLPVVTHSLDWMDSDRQWSAEVVDITTLPALSLLVIDHRGPVELIRPTIERLIELRQQLGLSPDISRTFNLNYSSHPDEQGNWHIGIAAEVPAAMKAAVHASRLPAGFRLHLFGAGEYARIRVQGGEAGLMFASRWLMTEWVPQSGYEMAEGIPLIERVQFPPMVSPEDALVDILVPIEQAL